MRLLATALAGILFLGMLQASDARAQNTGDYRSAASGEWGEAATWSTYDGAAWVGATAAPDGSEHITITDDVSVEGAVTVSGYVLVEDEGNLTVGAGSLTFADGSTYQHARDAGNVPVSTWESGSTFLLTGTTQDAPGNRVQDFHHVIFNTPNLGRNRDMGWNGNTIGGDVTVVSTGSNRWQLSSVSAGGTAAFSIMGDVNVQAGQFAVQGTGNALTVFEVNHHGNLNVTGGNFSLARGSQGNGSGSTTWIMHGGDVSMSNATTQNSNPTPGNAKYLFADGTSDLTFDNVTSAGGQFHFEVDQSAVLNVSDGFEVNGLVVNKGEINPQGSLTFLDGSRYEHARDGGSVPVSTWATGSTAAFTGITGSTPANRGQDYYHLVLDTPDLASNRDLSLDGNTVHGDIHVINTGNARWQLVGGSSGTVTIMGDVIVEAGQFAAQGTGSPTEVVVNHHGNIVVTGGNFSISRGSQGGEAGTGATRWNLRGDFSMSDATTQNSNPWRAAFAFTGSGEQTLHLEDVTYAGGGIAFAVANGTILAITGDPVGGNGSFTVENYGELQATHPDGFDALFGNAIDVRFHTLGGVRFSGTVAQQTGETLPDTLGVLTIANAQGVTVSDTTFARTLVVEEGALLILAEDGSLTAAAGTVDGTVINRGELIAESPLSFGSDAVYEHARNEGSIPSGTWSAGSTVMITGVVGNAPGNRNQSFHHLVFNTPDQTSNLNMGFDDVTIGGDITVLSTGAARWYLTSASAGDSAHVTLMGDVIVEDGQFSVHGTGNALTVFEVDHHGDIIVTGGNFSIARGSQGSGSGSTTWNLHGGDFRMSGATSQNSNPGNARFVFLGDGTQELELGDDNQLNHLPIEVRGGTTLEMGASVIEGSDIFVLEDGAYLATTHEGGVAGAIQTSGDVTLDSGASFVFNGSDAQVTSDLMPATVRDLWIDNPAGVTLSQETTIDGVLRLMAGELDDTIPFTIGANGSISFEGGTVTVSNEEVAELPAEFELYQNYPNPFNPSTTIRYDVRDNVHVSITVYDLTGRRVAQLVDQPHAAGTYKVEWNANALASGVYLYRINAGDFSAVRTLTLLK
jgi:hypothetical protein